MNQNKTVKKYYKICHSILFMYYIVCSVSFIMLVPILIGDIRSMILWRLLYILAELCNVLICGLAYINIFEKKSKVIFCVFYLNLNILGVIWIILELKRITYFFYFVKLFIIINLILISIIVLYRIYLSNIKSIPIEGMDEIYPLKLNYEYYSINI